MSGYLKPITDGNPQIEGGVPVCDAGPVVGWWVAGFDGGDREAIQMRLGTLGAGSKFVKAVLTYV